MGKNKIPTLIMNAEAFGFGPSSAIADFFPMVRDQFSSIAYVGGLHTLDLQIGLPYHDIFRLQGNHLATDESFKEIVKGFSGFLTALDFHYAELAIEMGVPCVIYDPLTWFWRSLPSIISNPNVLYLAQGFHGVQDVIENNQESFRNVRIVPPLVKRNQKFCEKNLVLINLGGLMNPYWSLNDCVQYASTIVEAASSVVRETGHELVVIGNRHLESALPNHNIIACSRQETKNLLPRVKVALSTPGLGNIYESSAYSIPTLFLPPPGDSHGQQLQSLITYNQVDKFIDWSNLDDSMFVDYKAPQDQVMQKISNHIRELSLSKRLRMKLSEMIQDKFSSLVCQNSSKSSQLLNQFGEDGASEVARLAFDFIQSKGDL